MDTKKRIEQQYIEIRGRLLDIRRFLVSQVALDANLAAIRAIDEYLEEYGSAGGVNGPKAR